MHLCFYSFFSPSPTRTDVRRRVRRDGSHAGIYVCYFRPTVTNQTLAIKKKGRGRKISSLSKHQKTFGGFEPWPTAWKQVGVRRRVCGSVGDQSSRCSTSSNSSLQILVSYCCSASQSVLFCSFFFSCLVLFSCWRKRNRS